MAQPPGSNAMGRALIDALARGTSPEFRGYCLNLGNRNDSNVYIPIVYHLMISHGTGNDWRNAWPIEVYIQHGVNFDTPWNNNPPAPNPMNVLQQTRIAFFNLLAQFKIAQAFPITLISLADEFRRAISLATTFQLLSRPPPFVAASGVSPAEHSMAVTAYMANMEGALQTWNDAVTNMRLDFGQDTPPVTELQMQANFAIQVCNNAVGSPIIVDAHRSTARIWITHLEALVRQRRQDQNIEWFLVQVNYIAECDRLGENVNIRPWPSAAATAYIQGPSSYRAMCRDLELRIHEMHDRRFDDTQDQWENFIRSGTTLAIRKQRYKAYVPMLRMGQGMGLSYPPNRTNRVGQMWNALQPLFNARDPNNTEYVPLITTAAALRQEGIFVEPPFWDTTFSAAHYVTLLRNAITRRDIPDFDYAWDTTIRREEYTRGAGPGLSNLQRLRHEMAQAVMNNAGHKLAYGPDVAERLEIWDQIRWDARLLPLNTRARFEDLEERVVDFYGRFGVLPPPSLPVPTPLSPQYAEALSQAAQLAMQKSSDNDWNLYENIVHPNDDDDYTDLVSLRAKRDSFVIRGQHYAPHDTIPNMMTRPENSQAMGFGALRSGIQGDWEFKRELGTGGFATASVWVQYNDRRDVVDRIVVKEAHFYNNGRFNDPVWWEGNMSRRVIKEEDISKQLSAMADSSSIVRSEGYALYEQKRMFRIYMEFCQHGNLDELIKRYARANPSPVDIPLRQIWATFDLLVTAICLCQLGKSAPPRRQNHIGIYHRDIKPENVFLGSPDPATWLGIPKSKLGDFGLAARFGDPGWHSPGGGTPGFRPPEQVIHALPAHRLRTIVTDKSDIWAVGKVILSMMNLRMDFTETTFSSLPTRPAFRAGVENKYPVNLCALVRACLRQNPAGRPTIQTLYDTIQTAITNMKTGGPLANELMLDVKPDPYPLFAGINAAQIP